MSNISPQYITDLLDNYIIVQEGEDDNFVRQCAFKSTLDSFASSHMSLSIAPTTACNFKCPYCYEKNKPNVWMTDDTIDKLVAFINSHRAVKTVGITWYGGEPLMGFPIMQKIVTKINNQCNAKLTNQSIVTNGYNINQSVIDFFKTQKLGRMQITIDGPEEEHNKTRILLNGNGTFKRIISNVRMIVDQLPNTKLQIRVNIDQHNQEGFIKLYKILKDEFGNKLWIYPGYIRINNDNETNITCDSMDQPKVRMFFDKLEQDGSLKIDYYPQSVRVKGCVATCTTAYVIGPEGELYKCWNDIGFSDRIVGYIDKDKLTNSFLYNQYMIDGQWMSDEKCKKCFFLPICSAGCAWQRVRNKFHNGSYDYCSLYQGEGIDRYLLLYYNKLSSK